MSALEQQAGYLVDVLRKAGFTAYFAGGSVRDKLLGRVAKDIDIATNARPEEVQKLFPRVTDVQGKIFGVVRILQNDFTFEVATFRQDGAYLDGRHPTQVSFASPEEDACRRDFTINGLFYDPIQQRVIDYVKGKEDLRNKVIRAIGDPRKRFQEDHLRLFRAIRFAAELDFEIEPVTWSALCEMVETTRTLSLERVRDELIKCFTGANPLKAFDLLDQSGLFKIWLPEIETLKGVEQPPQFHPEGDVFVHVRLMVSYLKYPSLTLAFSVLLHDIAKPATFKVDATGRIRFNEHETIGARMAEKIMQRLRFSNQQIEAVSTCVANHMAFKDVPNMRLSTLKRFLARPHIEEELKLHRIDCLCSHGSLDIYEFLLKKQEELGQEEIKPPPLVKGNDLIALGLPPGRELGNVLHQLEDEQLEGKLVDRETALKRAEELVLKIKKTHSQ